MQKLELFIGIGYDSDTLRVRHVDLRHRCKTLPFTWAH
jgi:hypothetical protein